MKTERGPITTILGVIIALCPILTTFFPDVKEVCERVLPEIIGLGFVAAADARFTTPKADTVISSLPNAGKLLVVGLIIMGLSACSTLKEVKSNFCQQTELCNAQK